MAFVLAAFYATLSGTTVTVQKQTNIASVVRWGVGQFTVTFATPMANTNYGVAADCRMPNNTGFDGPATCGPDRNTTGGHGAYSTTAVDIYCQSNSGATDPVGISFVAYDPASGLGGILAAASWTIATSTATVLASQGVGGVVWKAAGLY